MLKQFSASCQCLNSAILTSSSLRGHSVYRMIATCCRYRWKVETTSSAQKFWNLYMQCH